MKYFLLSSFASAFLLYGIAMTYGATGNTSFIVTYIPFSSITSQQHAPSIQR